MPTLSWDEFARDLRLARHWSENLYVHSLEGCVWQEYLEPLRSLDWEEVTTPPGHAWVTDLPRRALRGLLLAGTHPRRVVAAGGAAAFLLGLSRRLT
jgi:hypothetical protein